MPVVGVPIAALNQLIGREIPPEELFTHLERLGNDVDGITKLVRYKCGFCDYIMELVETEEVPQRCGSCHQAFKDEPSRLQEMDPLDVIRLELLPVRPDLFDVGGLARALKGYLSIETGAKDYPVREGNAVVKVDPRLAEPSSLRPAIACGIVRNVRLDDEFVKTIMKMQENLHWALGRNRKHASIGVYDLDKVTPNFSYDAILPEELEFVPLNGMPDLGMVAVTPAKVLEGHPKGKDFAHLLSGFERVPVLRDSEGRVLSTPPIINSEETRVTSESKNLIIDVTGFSRTLVTKCLNIVVTGLHEMDPSIEIESVEIEYESDRVRTPDMTVEHKNLDAKDAASLIGVDLPVEEVAESLRRMRYDVAQGSGSHLQVAIPPYRTDILHEVDLIEDVAMGYGFHKIGLEVCPTFTPGGELPLERMCGLTRTVLVGLGFLETLSLMLTSAESHFAKFGIEDASKRVVSTHNPASVDQAILRNHLMEGVMQSFALSVGDPYPQRFFEIGDVVEIDPEGETGTREDRRLALAVGSAKAGFAEIRSVVEALFGELGIEIDFEAAEHASMIQGRTARLRVLREGKALPVGWVGEVHPRVLEGFSVVQPVALAELSIAAAFEMPVGAEA